MKYREFTYKTKACPCCGWSAEAREVTLPGDGTGFKIKCTNCFLSTQVVLVDHPCIGPDGKPKEETRYTYYEAYKKSVDLWNARVGDNE